MKHLLSRPLSSLIIADALGVVHQGQEVQVIAVAPLSELECGVAAFSTGVFSSGLPSGVMVFVSREHSTLIASDSNIAIIAADNPRLAFIEFLSWLHEERLIGGINVDGEISPLASIDPTAVVTPGATIGANCHIGPHCHIHANVVLGNNVKVGASSVLGHDGFGYERNSKGFPIHFPHLAKLCVADDVVIGNQCSIARGVFDHTRIEEGVIIDDQVYIAHNVCVERQTFIMSGVRLNGRVFVGQQSRLGTGAMVKEGVKIGEKSVIGMGSVVIANVDCGDTVAGVPAKKLDVK